MAASERSPSIATICTSIDRARIFRDQTIATVGTADTNRKLNPIGARAGRAIGELRPSATAVCSLVHTVVANIDIQGVRITRVDDRIRDLSGMDGSPGDTAIRGTFESAFARHIDM